MKKIVEKLSLLSLSLMLVSAFAPSPALPKMIAYFQKQGYSESHVEWLFSIPSFSIILILLLTPWLSRKLSERMTIVLGLLCLSFGGSLPLIKDAYPLVVISRVILGIGIGLINVRAISIISETYKGRERVQMLGFRASFEVLGTAILTALVGFLLGFGWSFAFAIYLFGLPILVFYLIFSPQPQYFEGDEKEEWEEERSVFSMKQLTTIVGFALVAAFAINVNSANSLRLPVLVTALKLGTDSQASLILSATMAMGIVAGICFSFLSNRLGRALVPLSFLIFAVSLLMIGLTRNILVLTLGSMVTGLIYSILVTSSFNTMSEIIPRHLISRATTIILVFCNLGGASASLTLGLFSQLSKNPSFPFLVLGVISALLAIASFAKKFLSA